MFANIKNSRPLQAAFLLVLVLAAYPPSLYNGFIWDDNAYVSDNPSLTTLEGLKKIWLSRDTTPQYYPMVFTGFWAEYQIFGPNPAVFHITNITLHCANALLVWLILLRLRLPWAWLAAALFAIHPVNVESAAWITERKNVMSGLFALSSLLILIRLYLNDPDKAAEVEEPSKNRRQALYAVSLLLFVFALLSKSVTCMMPVVFLILAWWKQKNLSLKTATATTPFFIAGIAAGINTSLVEKLYVGAHGPEWDISIIERVLIAGRALWFYAYKLLWPAELIFIYPRWHVDATVWWQYLFPVAVLILFPALFAARNRIGKGPFAGAAIFTATLLPALGFINYYPMRYSFVADHFQYLASIALIALAVAGAYRLAADRRQAYIPVYGLFAGLILVMGMRTWQEQGKYKNLQTLWEDTIKKNPACWMAYNNLGGVLIDQQGLSDKALDAFAITMKMNPDFPEARYNMARVLMRRGEFDTAMNYYRYLLKHHPRAHPKLLADIHYDMGIIFAKRSQIDDAEAHFRQALELKPRFPEGYNDLGILMRQAGKFDKAIDAFSKAIAVKPDYAEARYNLAQVLYDSGQPEKAMVYYNFLLHDAGTPSTLLASIHNDLGVINTRQHRLEAAEEHLSKALALQPDSARFHNNLGLLTIEAGKTDKALEAFSKAVALDPGYAKARYQLALISAGKGDTETAISHYTYILAQGPAVSPDLLVNVHNDLGVIYAGQNRIDTAIHHFTNALSIKPDFVDAANNLVVAYSGAKQYDKALTVLESLLDAVPGSSASISYNIACIHSIRGDLKSAAVWLEKAIDRGFRLQGLLESDADLENIRKSRYYPGLLERMRQAETGAKG